MIEQIIILAIILLSPHNLYNILDIRYRIVYDFQNNSEKAKINIQRYFLALHLRCHGI